VSWTGNFNAERDAATTRKAVYSLDTFVPRCLHCCFLSDVHVQFIGEAKGMTKLSLLRVPNYILHIFAHFAPFWAVFTMVQAVHPGMSDCEFQKTNHGQVI
jgi:hypothetical protein